MTTIDTADDECKHGIFPVGSCTTCSGKDAAIRKMEDTLQNLHINYDSNREENKRHSKACKHSWSRWFVIDSRTLERHCAYCTEKQTETRS